MCVEAAREGQKAAARGAARRGARLSLQLCHSQAAGPAWWGCYMTGWGCRRLTAHISASPIASCRGARQGRHGAPALRSGRGQVHAQERRRGGAGHARRCCAVAGLAGTRLARYK